MVIQLLLTAESERLPQSHFLWTVTLTTTAPLVGSLLLVQIDSAFLHSTNREIYFLFIFFLWWRVFFYHIPNIFQFLVHVTCLEFLSSWRHFSGSLTINYLFLPRPCFDFWINVTISWNTYLPFSLSSSSLCWQIPSRRDVKMIFLNLCSTKIYFILPSHLIKNLAEESQVQNNFPQNIKGCFAVL